MRGAAESFGEAALRIIGSNFFYIYPRESLLPKEPQQSRRRKLYEDHSACRRQRRAQRPLTNNMPKCLLPVGGKTIIDWIVADTLPLHATETIFITGHKASAAEEFLKNRPQWGKTRTVLQGDPQGLGQAISLALPYVSDDEPLLIILGDTLFQADIQSLANAGENILYTYKVTDPHRFGVAVTDAEGRIERLVEKPQEFVSDEATVGIYYIKDVKALRESLQYLMDNDIRTRGKLCA